MELDYVNRFGYDQPWIDFMLTTSRKFGKIKLNKMRNIESKKNIDVFRRHGANVVRLCLMGSCILSYIKFAELLKCLPNLKEVIMVETSCEEGDVPPDLPELNKLKTLEMVASSYNIIKIFQKAKVTTLKLLNSSCRHSFYCQALEDFLKSQEMLTALAIRTVHHDDSMMFRTDATMPFQLTQLSLLNIQLRESANDYNNLLKFLQPQAKTLNELEIGRKFPSFVFEFIFAKMTNLKTLSLMMSQIPQYKQFYERLEENRSINKLILLDSSSYNNDTLRFLRDFLDRLPNIESLTLLEYCDRTTLLVMAQSLKKLKTLVTFSFNEDVIQGVQFPNLNSLSIQFLDDRVDWNEFTKINSRLTELTIEQMFDAAFLNVDDIEHITTNIQLQTLRIGENLAADNRFLEIIRKNCPNLNTLDLHKNSVSDELKDFSLLRLCESEVIKCPKHFQLWTEDDYDLKYPFDDDNGWDTDGDVLDFSDDFFCLLLWSQGVHSS